MTDHSEDIAYIRKRVDDVYDSVTEVKERTAKLEVKAGFWGAVSGFFTTALLYMGFRR